MIINRVPWGGEHPYIVMKSLGMLVVKLELNL